MPPNASTTRPSQTQAAMIAIGSELLCGQITNRNAAWLSDKLFDLGIGTRHHATVDDAEADMLRGLDSAAEQADLIITTGGLGPTSDDLTRSVVAKWCGVELDYDPPSWDHITAIFARFSGHVPETNRQQCYFPRGARILVNNAGTANAFTITSREKEIWVLPGPPREVETIWREHMQTAFAGRVPPEDRAVMRMWRTIGRGESHVAEVIEPLITEAHRHQGLELAYRAHPPVIETKLKFRAADAPHFAALSESVDAALAPWLYEKDREDHHQRLVRLIAARMTPVAIFDTFTHGQIAEALQPLLREMRAFKADFHALGGSVFQAPLDGDYLAVEPAGADPDNWRISARLGGRQESSDKKAAYRGEPMRARNEKSVAALAVKIWADWLSATTPSP